MAVQNGALNFVQTTGRSLEFRVVGQFADRCRDGVDGFRLKPLVKLGFEKFEAFGAAAWAEFTLPDDDGVPAKALKFPDVIRVAFLVAADFLRPEVGIGLRNRGVAAERMTVPEAAVDEDDRVIFPEDDVRASRQVLAVQGIAEPVRMQKPAYKHLGARIDAPNPRHTVMPLLFCHLVRHVLVSGCLPPGSCRRILVSGLLFPGAFLPADSCLTAKVGKIADYSSAQI